MAFSFFVVSDPHLYSARLGTSGAAYDLDNAKSQKLLAESAKAITAAFTQIWQDTRADVVLISGDLVNNGELPSHAEMIAKLRTLQGRGKRIFLITSTHDYDKSFRYEGEKKLSVPNARREQLWEMYYDFGPAQALARHLPTFSYTAQLAPGYRLLALNDDRDGTGHSGFSADTLEWVAAQIQAAREAGDFIIPMTHHPLLSPSPFYSLIGAGDMSNNAQTTIAALLRCGIHFCFTGHSHIQDISYQDTAPGTRFYAISTPSLVGYPGTYRFCTADKEARTLTVTTPPPSEETQGYVEKMDAQFFGMIRAVLAAARTDKNRFAETAQAFSVKPAFSRKFWPLIHWGAKYLSSLTVGKVARFVRYKEPDLAAVRAMKVDDFVLDLVMHLYGGDAPYTPDTALYKITVRLCEKLDKILAVLHINLQKPLKGMNLRQLVEPLLYNQGVCDKEAVLSDL